MRSIDHRLRTGAGRSPERVALVHDWLTGMRGGEKVLEAIARMYPDAVIHTLLHVKGSVSAPLEARRERRSFVQWLPASARHYRQYLPLFPAAIECFDFDGCDLVISTSHCAAKSVVVPGRTMHVCYCHSPMRYAWDQFDSYFGPDQVGATRSRLLRPVLARLARWDRATADRVDRYVANSHYVAGRISRYYNRGSTVVYPPVDTVFYRPDPGRPPGPAFLAVSALVPYKRLDVAIRAAAAAGVPLTIVGRGPEEERLRQLAGTVKAAVTFTGWLGDDEIRDHYRACRAVVMPGVEDFGMVPVEAQACGRPVVALAEGGALESVVDGITGILVRDRSVEAFAEGLREASSRDFDGAAICRHAESFGVARFEQQFRAVIEEGACPLPSSDAVSKAARYRVDRGDAADRDSETQPSSPDARETSLRQPMDPDAVSKAARYRVDRGDAADRDSETQPSSPDARETSLRQPIDPDAVSKAARYRVDRADAADRDSETQPSSPDARETSLRQPIDPDAVSKAARYRVDRADAADRENEK